MITGSEFHQPEFNSSRNKRQGSNSQNNHSSQSGLHNIPAPDLFRQPGRKSSRKFYNNFIVLPLVISIITFASIIMVCLATWNIAHANEADQGKNGVLLSQLVRPGDMNSGGLLFPSREPGYYVEAPKLHTDVRIDITGPIIRTRVSQKFENPTDKFVEGIYVFPLPDDAAVDTLKMKIGDRLIEGIIKPRQEAREIYEQAKEEGKKAALLEQQRANIFTNAVANIGPGESIIVQIEYQRIAQLASDQFSLRFPLVVAPRYNPEPIRHNVKFDKNDKNGWGQINPVPDRNKITPPVLDPEIHGKINPVTITVNLNAGFPLSDIKSPYHQINIKRDGDQKASIDLTDGKVPADKDFELIWKPKGTTPGAALFTEQVEGKDYILAYITPPATTPDLNLRKNREIVFVIDNSGSMAGQSIQQAKLALSKALSRLTSDDNFNIIRFDNTHELLFPSAIPATEANIARAQSFVSRLEAQGGTEMLSALNAALVDGNINDTDRVRQVIFITDGAIGNEQQLFNAIKSAKGRSRVFTIGIGSAPNTFFMRRAAEIGRGTFTHIGAVDEVNARLSKFFDKLENPVLTGLRAEVKGSKLSQVSPDPLPDLYAGEPIILAAQISSVSGTMTISGIFENRPWNISMRLNNATSGKGIGKLWARRKIASLEASRSDRFLPARIDRNIETIAMEHHLVSRLTSLVAVDVTKSRPDNQKLHSTELPTNLPEGWEFDKVFDASQARNATIKIDPRNNSTINIRSKTRAMRKQAFLQTAQLMAPSPPQNPGIVKNSTLNQVRSVTLPRTATNADRNIILGGMLLLLASVLIVLTAMWQQVGMIAKKQGTRLKSRDYSRLP